MNSQGFQVVSSSQLMQIVEIVEVITMKVEGPEVGIVLEIIINVL